MESAKIVSKSTGISPRIALTSYDTNKAKLRAANFIEGILNVQENMSTTEIYKLGVTYANKARDAAISEFPITSTENNNPISTADYNNVMLRDSFRHFTWNNMATRDIGNIKTRTGTINHEWGIKMLDPMTKYFDSQYNTYRGKGYSVDNASNYALADSVNYIPSFKYNVVSICKGSYTFFKSFFDISNIMDLHNNCWGRAYAGNYSYYGWSTAYYISKSHGELILAENKVTNSNFDYVWRSQWYTY